MQSQFRQRTISFYSPRPFVVYFSVMEGEGHQDAINHLLELGHAKHWMHSYRLLCQEFSEGHIEEEGLSWFIKPQDLYLQTSRLAVSLLISIILSLPYCVWYYCLSHAIAKRRRMGPVLMLDQCHASDGDTNATLCIVKSASSCS